MTTTEEIQIRRLELRAAVEDLRDRGLYAAAKWAAEQLVGLPKTAQRSHGAHPRATPTKSSAAAEREAIGSSGDRDRHGDANELEEADEVVLGKSFFDMQEYRRAAHVLREYTCGKGFFLHCHALYLAGEKRKEEEIIESGGPLGRGGASNEETPALEQTLRPKFEGGSLDAFGLYVYGRVLRDRERSEEAKDALCASVNEYPWNWSAWMELQGHHASSTLFHHKILESMLQGIMKTLCTDSNTLKAVLSRVNDHWIRPFFEASVLLDLHLNAEGLVVYQSLQAHFPNSDYLTAQVAVAHYNLREYDISESQFEGMLKTDPYRIENMDVYSNILYVKELAPALSYLAHKAILIDKYRPETCCIIGNYYSLKSQHEKAVQYFQRALKLNRNYLSAWTLIGHEYVELKNSPAAIDCYRRAVDINPRDYRAWYGLGQTYEILGMPYYALYYYRRATDLRPEDPRMWVALGQCFESSGLEEHEAAIRCYERAEKNNDREGIALSKLAKLHAELGHAEQAAMYYRRNLKRMEREQIEGQDTTEALLYVATFLKNEGLLEEAEKVCSQLLDYGGKPKEDGKALLREIHSKQAHVRGGPSFSSPLMDMDSYSP